MGVTARTCYIVVSDCCNQKLEIDTYGDYQYVPHSDTEAEAFALLAGDMDDPRYDQESDEYTGDEHIKATLIDGEIVCWTCLAPRLCLERGHRFTDWHTCRCTANLGNPDGPKVPARIPAHRANGCTQSRRCRRCEHHEERPITAEGDTAATTGPEGA